MYVDLLDEDDDLLLLEDDEGFFDDELKTVIFPDLSRLRRIGLRNFGDVFFFQL